VSVEPGDGSIVRPETIVVATELPDPALVAKEHEHVERLRGSFQAFPREGPGGRAPVWPSTRPRGPASQEDRRAAEWAVKMAAVNCSRAFGEAGLTWQERALGLGVPDRTLREWDSLSRRKPFTFVLRGRRTTRSPLLIRQLALDILRDLGPHIGLRSLRPLVPLMGCRELEDFLRRWKGFIGRYPFLCVPGDREYTDADGNTATEFKNYFEEFATTDPSRTPPTRLWGSFDYLNCRFVFLDTRRIQDADEYPDWLGWLRGVLSGANPNHWRIVVMHIPPCTDGSGYAWNETVIARCRGNFASLFEECRVDIVLSGHSHLFERWLYNGDANQNGDDSSDFQNGVNYVVTGGLGAELHFYNPDNSARPRAFPSGVPVPPPSTSGLNHYCTLDINEDQNRNPDPLLRKATLRVWKISGEEWEYNDASATYEFTRRDK